MKTDRQLQQDVVDELKWDPFNAAQVGVEVKSGVVTLSGHVDSYSDKWNAGRAAQRVSGVTTLAIEIDIKLSDFGKRNDTDIAAAAHSALQWSTLLQKDSVFVKVTNGWITLTGEVEWQYQRRTASDVMRQLSGVLGVTDNIRIRSKTPGIAVKSDIEAALRRRAKIDAQPISVNLHGGDVTLTGVVRSWSERELATHSVWGAPGVRNVIERMTLVD